MAAKYAKIDRVCTLDADFKQICLFKLPEIFTILLWNINNLKSMKKSKSIFFSIEKKETPKIQVTIEIAYLFWS